MTHFEVTKDEPAFSVNLKRGIAALFNLNFDQGESGPSTEENDVIRQDPDAHYYKLYEVSASFQDNITGRNKSFLRK